MKLRINKACHLASISILPPRRTGGGGGGGKSASASAAASQQRSQSMSQQSFSQGGGGASFSQSFGASFSQGLGSVGASFSQGSGSGGAEFSQGGGAGGAAVSQGGRDGGTSFSQGGGGGASFSQGGGGGGAAFSHGSGGGGASFCKDGGSTSHLHSKSQISQASLSPRHPSPALHQRFALPDDSSKRISSCPAISVSVVLEESQLQLGKISSKPIHRWNPSLQDSRLGQMNEDVERKFQHLASSVHKMGMVLDSVQNDVMQLNRAMKEASIDSDSIQKKFVLVENSLQQIVKGQDDLKALFEGSTTSYLDQLSVLNSHTSKLDDISSTLPVLKQVQADLRLLKIDIFRIFSEEIEGIVRAIRSVICRPDAMQAPTAVSCTTNGKSLINQASVASPLVNQRTDGKQTPEANGRSQMNQMPVANARPQKKQTPVANGRPQINDAHIAYGILKMNQAPEANGKALIKQVPVEKVVPAPLVYHRKVKDLKPKAEEQKAAKAGAQNSDRSSCCELQTPKQGELGMQTKKAPWSIIIDLDEEEEEEEGSDGSASCIILKTRTGVARELMEEEAVSDDATEILRRARKRRRREQRKGTVLFQE